jgi:hypothetical protein
MDIGNTIITGFLCAWHDGSPSFDQMLTTNLVSRSKGDCARPLQIYLERGTPCLRPRLSIVSKPSHAPRDEPSIHLSGFTPPDLRDFPNPLVRGGNFRQLHLAREHIVNHARLRPAKYLETLVFCANLPRKSPREMKCCVTTTRKSVGRLIA